MVQITNALLIAAAVSPAFAAPLETREPRVSGSSLRQVAKVTGKVVSGAGAVATVGSLVMPQGQQQQRRSLETREPRITSTQAKSIVKGAAEVGKAAQNGIEFGAAVAPLFPHKSRRSLEDLESRALRMPSHSSMRAIGGAVVGAAGFGGTIAAMNTQSPHQRRELEAREPRITSTQAKSIVKGAAQVGKAAQNGIEFGAAVAPLFPHKSRRSLEDLETRALRMPSHSSMRAVGGAVVGAAGFGGTIAAMNTKSPQQRRELEAREPKFLSKAFMDVGPMVARPKLALREDELDVREPDFLSMQRIHPPTGKIMGREENIEAREPNFFSKVFKDVTKVAKLALREDELDAREPDYFAVQKLHNGQIRQLAREENIEAREPNFFSKVFKDVGKVAQIAIREDENGGLYVRDYSDEYYLD